MDLPHCLSIALHNPCLYAVLKYVSAYTSALSINLEPIYGSVLAYYIFHENEQLNRGFYFGTVIIVSSVFLHPLL